MPTETERTVLLEHVDEIDEWLRKTPDNDMDSARATLVIVTKMLLVLPSQRASEESAEAKGDAYMIALGDVPSWAVEESARGWYRRSYGIDRDYKWMPGPSELREIAAIEAQRLGARMGRITALLGAEPMIEMSAEHCSEMRKRLAEVMPKPAPIGAR
jgi:hypothetical protein